MVAKDNFFKAMKELTGISTTEEDAFKELEDSVEDVKPVENIIANTFDNRVNEEKEIDRRNALFDREKALGITKPLSPATIISASMVVIGEIKSKGDIEILGTVKGPIATTGNMSIQGKVLGNLQGKNIFLKGCAIQGNIVASGDIIVDADSVLIGDVKANNISVNGKIKGCLDIQQTIELNKDAVVDGDASSRYVSMNQGAKLNGRVSIISDDHKNDGTFNIKFDV